MSEQSTKVNKMDLPSDYYDDPDRFVIWPRFRNRVAQPALTNLAAILHGRTEVVVPEKVNVAERPYIIAATHRHWEDIPRTAIAAKAAGIDFLRFPFKADYYHSRFGSGRLIGPLFERLGGVAVMRGGGDVESFTDLMANFLDQNQTIAIYPEGTRKRVGPRDLADTKPGAVRIALRSQVDIVPLAIAGISKDEEGRRPLGFGKPVVAAFGDPIGVPVVDVSTMEKADHNALMGEVHATLRTAMQATLNEAYRIRDAA